MKKRVLFLLIVVFGILPPAAFYVGWTWMEAAFRLNKYPYPFERFGLVAGFGMACWAFAFAFLVKTMLDKRRSS